MTLEEVFHTEAVEQARRVIDAHVLDRKVNLRADLDDHLAAAQLRVAAIASFTDLLAGFTVDAWLRRAERGAVEGGLAQECFENWQAYLNSIGEHRGGLDDLLSFAVAGFLARKPHEVRDFLRRKATRQWVDEEAAALDGAPWLVRVRSYVSLSVIYIVRQSHRADFEAATTMLKILGGMQKQFEADWLAQRSSQRHDALQLLSYYHAAQAVMRTSEFLMSGNVETEGRQVNDVIAELRRLLVRAEEFALLSNDVETSQWLLVTTIALSSLRETSIWIQSRGISARIDLLLDELTREGRAHPVFSLLPSQQDALQRAFLDPSRVAIVLQMPTSAGKTLLAEFSIAQTFDAYRDQARVVYLVPTRALATQTRRTLAEDLGPLKINVSAAGSAFEEDPYELQLLSESDGVVVATPEKLDLMLRAHPAWFSLLRLVIVDEAHLINDGERGARLELLLANLRREQPEARMVLLTPFMDNAEQIAIWLSRERGHSVDVQWRPSRVLLGKTRLTCEEKIWNLQVEWVDPYAPSKKLTPLSIPFGPKKGLFANNIDRVVFLGRKFRPLGTALALFSASPASAETAARLYAEDAQVIPEDQQPPQLRLAIALVRHEFGSDSTLAACLERGVAFHHSSLSPILRYLIEDQIRARTIKFAAATSTLAQGMNFPVATVIVHSVHKPRGRGNLSPSEFWNVAGRSGRVGMVENGLVVFADPKHAKHVEHYASELRNTLTSALLKILPGLNVDVRLKDQYRDVPALRPFIQYLAHAAATSSVERAAADIEELIQQSLANQQAQSGAESKTLRHIARRYFAELVGAERGMLIAADQTGLATFSFNELYAKVRSDPILTAGPNEVLAQRAEGMHHLVEALRWLPELDLAIGFGEGHMDVTSVAKVVDGWIRGQRVSELATLFPGDDESERGRNAAKYIYGTISQTMSWGAHAYLRGWLMNIPKANELAARDKMLPAYIQYGVHTPEAAVASLLGVPRAFAEAIGEDFRTRVGTLTPEGAGKFKTYIETASNETWSRVTERAGVVDVNAKDLRAVFRQMQGLPN